MNTSIVTKTSEVLSISEKSITAVLSLIEEGATIPFIARYRKEKTGNLDEDQIRKIITTYDYELKLLTRKEEVIRLISEKGKLTPELEQAILNATMLKEVEDLYLPYKEKKKTRASVAIAKGLEPLADWLLRCEANDPEIEAQKYVNDQVLNVEEALQGAKDIIAERIADSHDYREALRKNIYRFGRIRTTLKKKAVDERQVYKDYYDFQKPVKYVMNHQILAINRGENEDILKVELIPNEEEYINYLKRKIVRKDNRPSNKYLHEAIIDGYERLLFPSIEREIRNDLTEKAHDSAINLFTKSLEQLLLTPPLKGKWMLGVDPAFRTGCKLAVINPSGDFIFKDVIYPHQKYPGENVPIGRYQEAQRKVADLVEKYHIELIAIGNGTASRESEEFIAKVIKNFHLNAKYIIVSEAGASVYSASELAKKEFPNLVVEERSAISIARRVIDPLAELIKIDPKSIGVGQYQHDVNQSKLEDGLNFTITKVVNNVGVNINSASPSLLSYVSGLTKKTAENIVDYRKEKGKINTRSELKEVKGIGPKSYEQAIGFLKILESPNPLDKTFIHPDDYQFVYNLLSDCGLSLNDVGSEKLRLSFEHLDRNKVIEKYGVGEYTLNDIIAELTRPLRDIRDDYPNPLLKSDVLHIEDLKPDMVLEGTVRSVVDFGVFVDIGLKNDGMIHRSKLSYESFNHPLDIVSIGQIVQVYVLGVDMERKRVSLSLIKPN